MAQGPRGDSRRGLPGDAEVGSFTQSYGSKELDAALLLIPIVEFLPPDDERVRGTVAAVERELCRDGFVTRYRTGGTDDGLPRGEGAFLACTFWLADNLVLQGRLAEARRIFERLVALHRLRAARRGARPRGGAFSHVALVNTACNLSRPEGPSDRRKADE